MQRVFNECQVVPAFSISAFSVDRNLPGELSEVCFCRSRHCCCCCCCCCVDLQSLCLNLLQEGPTSLPLQGLHQASFRTHRIVHHAISATAGTAGFVELLFYSRLLKFCYHILALSPTFYNWQSRSAPTTREQALSDFFSTSNTG